MDLVKLEAKVLEMVGRPFTVSTQSLYKNKRLFLRVEPEGDAESIDFVIYGEKWEQIEVEFFEELEKQIKPKE